MIRRLLKKKNKVLIPVNELHKISQNYVAENLGYSNPDKTLKRTKTLLDDNFIF
jgi:hypothetical protein